MAQLRAMSCLWILYSLVLKAGGVSIMENCSYQHLQHHLGLSQKNEGTTGLRPVKNWTKSTHVMVDMLLLGVMDMNEKTSTFTSHVLISTGWVNDFIAWKPEEFCGISKMTVPRDRLWTPDISIQEDISDTGSTLSSPYVQVYNWAFAQVIDQRRLTITCKMDLYKFPFDSQSCSITFRSMIHRASELTLRAFTNTTLLNHITMNSITTLDEWDFMGIAMKEENINFGENNEWHLLIYKIQLRRRPLLYIINLVVPIAFFLVFDLASYFIKGEKLGFKVTILLSISVLLLILNDILPSTSNNLPVIALYCIVIFVLTGLSLLETMLVSFLMDLDSKADQKVQATAKSSQETTGETGCQIEHERDDVSSMKKSEDTFNNKDLDEDRLIHPRPLYIILELVQKIPQEWLLVNMNTVKSKPGYWERMAICVDKVYFSFYLITAIGFVIFITLMWLQ